MSTQDAAERDLQVLYQADEKPPAGLTLGLGLQLAFLSLGGILLPPMIVYRVAGATDAVLTWAVFASLLVAGAVTALHAFPIRRFGAGYFLVSGTTAAAIAVSVDALAAGGPALLFCLMLAAALFQFLFSFRISIFRRILTPAVSGTVLMLIPLTIAPIVFGRIADVPAGHSQSSGLACALATLAPIVLLVFKGDAGCDPGLRLSESAPVRRLPEHTAFTMSTGSPKRRGSDSLRPHGPYSQSISDRLSGDSCRRSCS